MCWILTGSAGHGFVMKIGDFGMSRHISLAKRPDGTVSLVRQLSTGASPDTAENAYAFVPEHVAHLEHTSLGKGNAFHLHEILPG